MSCVAFGCKNRSSRKSKKQTKNESDNKITFHKFPKDPVRRARWIKAVRRKDWTPSSFSLLCSQHFSDDCFDKTSLCVVRLKDHAVPSIFPAYPAHLQRRLNKNFRIQEDSLNLEPLEMVSVTLKEEATDDLTWEDGAFRECMTPCAGTTRNTDETAARNTRFVKATHEDSPSCKQFRDVASGGSSGADESIGRGAETSAHEDVELALAALQHDNMSFAKASAAHGIPSTLLWQRARCTAVETPVKEAPTKSWVEEDMKNALEALRTGVLSANKASKAYGIPSYVLCKVAHREGIRLALPFSMAPTTWTRADLERALTALRAGGASVQRVALQFGVPSWTLYRRCRREGIELPGIPRVWSDDAMGKAVEAVLDGRMTVSQAADTFDLPYSTLYNRLKRVEEPPWQGDKASWSLLATSTAC